MTLVLKVGIVSHEGNKVGSIQCCYMGNVATAEGRIT